MPKNFLFFLALTVVLLTGYLTLAINAKLPGSVTKLEIETAINQAKHLYKQESQKGRDFSNGPCLSDALMPGWVVDIAHNPRIEIDNLSQNQCPAFLEGKAQHFVELDLLGNVITAK